MLYVSERPRSLLLSLGVPSRPSPGSDPGPVQVPSRVPSGPVQIRHALCFTVFRTHPGPEVGAILAPGAIPARPGPILFFHDRAWTGRSLLDERQITHLICAHLKCDLYDFFRGCFGAFYTRRRTGSRPKTPLKKSYRSYFRQAQIR